MRLLLRRKGKAITSAESYNKKSNDNIINSSDSLELLENDEDNFDDYDPDYTPTTGLVLTDSDHHKLEQYEKAEYEDSVVAGASSIAPLWGLHRIASNGYEQSYEDQQQKRRQRQRSQELHIKVPPRATSSNVSFKNPADANDGCTSMESEEKVTFKSTGSTKMRQSYHQRRQKDGWERSSCNSSIGTMTVGEDRRLIMFDDDCPTRFDDDSRLGGEDGDSLRYSSPAAATSKYRSSTIDQILEGTAKLRCSKRKYKKKDIPNSSSRLNTVTTTIDTNTTQWWASNHNSSNITNHGNNNNHQGKVTVKKPTMKHFLYKKLGNQNEDTKSQDDYDFVEQHFKSRKSLFWCTSEGKLNNESNMKVFDRKNKESRKTMLNRTPDAVSESSSFDSSSSSDAEEDVDSELHLLSRETASFLTRISSQNQQRRQLRTSTQSELELSPTLQAADITTKLSTFVDVHGNDHNSWLWNYNLICLSVLDNRICRIPRNSNNGHNKNSNNMELLLDENGRWNSSLFSSSEQRIVKDSIRNFIKLQLSSSSLNNTANDDTDDRDNMRSSNSTVGDCSVPVDVDSFYVNNKKKHSSKKSHRCHRKIDKRSRVEEIGHEGDGRGADAVDDDDDDCSEVKRQNSIVEQSDSLAIDFMNANNFESAVGVYKILLSKQEEIFNDVSRYHSSSSAKFWRADWAITKTLRKLTMLCLAANNNGNSQHCRSKHVEALLYNTEHAKRLQKYMQQSNVTTHIDHYSDKYKHHHEQIQAIIDCKMEEGLVQFSSHRVSKAFKCWREAIHMAIGITGYQNQLQESLLAISVSPHVAVLLNNVGVLHLFSGALHDSSRTLEESIEVQKISLRSTSCNRFSHNDNLGSVNGKGVVVSQMNLDNALFQLATTMSNLAIVHERAYQYSKAITLLDEAHMILDSITADTTSMRTSIQQNQERLVGDQGKLILHARTEDEDGVTMDMDDHSVDSARSSLLFGNGDGIPDNQNRRRRTLASRLAMETIDQHDFLLLGPLWEELSTEQRVLETINVWFGKRVIVPFDDEDDGSYENDSLLMEESLPSKQKVLAMKDSVISSLISSGTTAAEESIVSGPKRSKETIPVDVDGHNIVNAELHLNAIYRQAMIHLDHDEVNDALELFRSTLRNHREKYGDIHHLVGTALHNIGMVHFFGRQYEQAMVTFQEAVNVRVAALGIDHPDVQLSMLKIALVQLATGDLSSSRATLWEIREKSLELLGYWHPNVAKIMNNIGVVAYECGDLVNSFRSFEIAYEYQKRLYEEMASSSQETTATPMPMNTYTTLQSSIHKSFFAGAAPTHTPKDPHQTKSVELAAIATAQILCNMGFVYGKDGGEKEEALKLYQRALRLLKKHIPREDERCMELRRNIHYLSGSFYNDGQSINTNNPPIGGVSEMANMFMNHPQKLCLLETVVDEQIPVEISTSSSSIKEAHSKTSQHHHRRFPSLISLSSQNGNNNNFVLACLADNPLISWFETFSFVDGRKHDSY